MSNHSAPMAPLLIIGIGSPFGDDRAGWAVVEQLKRVNLPAQVKLLCLDRPGSALIEWMQGHEQVILVDAMLSDDHPPGQCIKLTPEQLARENSPSSHGFGLAQALALARALDQLPDKLRLYGISIPSQPDGEGLSKEVSAAVCALAQQLYRDIHTAIGKGGVGSLGSSSSSS